MPSLSSRTFETVLADEPFMTADKLRRFRRSPENLLDLVLVRPNLPRSASRYSR
jgi:hypothetical protein